MIISQEALTMYIFQPMLARPIGMMKTKMSLEVISKKRTAYTHVWKLTQAHLASGRRKQAHSHE